MTEVKSSRRKFLKTGAAAIAGGAALAAPSIAIAAKPVVLKGLCVYIFGQYHPSDRFN